MPYPQRKNSYPERKLVSDKSDDRFEVQNLNDGRREMAAAPARSLYEQGVNAKTASNNEGTDCHGQGGSSSRWS
jgi:hypothetical protein